MCTSTSLKTEATNFLLPQERVMEIFSQGQIRDREKEREREREREDWPLHQIFTESTPETKSQAFYNHGTWGEKIYKKFISKEIQ